MRQRLFILAACAAVLLTAGLACGGNDDDGEGNDGTATAAAETTVRSLGFDPSGTPTGDSTAGPAGDATAAGSSPAPDATAPAPIPTTPATSGTFRIVVDAPPSASGTLDVPVRVENVTAGYSAFNIAIDFDPALLEPLGAEAGSALGPSDNTFCAPEQVDEEQGVLVLGCTRLGTSASTDSGVLATFRFRVKTAGSAELRLVPYSEGGALGGTFLADSSTGEPVPVEGELVNDTVAVS